MWIWQELSILISKLPEIDGRTCHTRRQKDTKTLAHLRLPQYTPDSCIRPISCRENDALHVIIMFPAPLIGTSSTRTRYGPFLRSHFFPVHPGPYSDSWPHIHIWNLIEPTFVDTFAYDIPTQVQTTFIKR